jgi:hypothetical protein
MEGVDVGTDRATGLVAAVLEREMRLLREAIAMVAGGGAPRVILVGLRFGDRMLDPAQRIALEAGVAVTPMWRLGAGADLSVERISE